MRCLSMIVPTAFADQLRRAAGGNLDALVVRCLATFGDAVPPGFHERCCRAAVTGGGRVRLNLTLPDADAERLLALSAGLALPPGQVLAGVVGVAAQRLLAG